MVWPFLYIQMEYWRWNGSANQSWMLQGGLSLQHSSALQLARLHPMLHENLATLFGPAAQQGNNVKWTHEEWDENNTPSSSAEEGVIVNFIDLHLSLCWNDFFFQLWWTMINRIFILEWFFFKKDPFKQSKKIGPTRMYYVYQLQLYIRAH